MSSLGPSASRKLDLMFEGIRYTPSLGEAAAHSFPNFYPYRFQPGETNPTGKTTVAIPYLLKSPDGSMVRVKGAGSSAWNVSGSRADGYRLSRDGAEKFEVDFEPLPAWMQAETSDGFSMARTGLSLHGDMGVINIAPGCEYFLEKIDGVSMRCTFCAYGAPDKRTQDLGQEARITALPVRTYERIQETLRAALDESPLRHLYLVGGSMTDWREEGRRFIEIAKAVQEVNQHKVPVTCGSGALPDDILEELYEAQLVQAVCFNLEIWSKSLFEKICPGKNRFVGYDRWIQSLEHAVGLWGRERVYTAMVAGIELEPEHGLSWEQAADLAIEGAEFLCSRGIIPIYSLHWPVGGRDHPEYMNRLRSYFERLSLGYEAIRRKYDLGIWEGFMCRHCAYMQLECDIDHEAGIESSQKSTAQ
ncbi:MAG: radical SAM protein [Proteobacteria bacterium]|nr:radical SAM protein [Pseudomonadota bacterium]